MATFLDVTGLQHFTSVFVFLFVWLVTYGILLWSKVLGDNRFIHALLSLLFSIFVLMSPFAIQLIAGIAPFIAVLMLFVVLISIAGKMFGGDIESFSALRGVFFVFVVLIIIIAVGVQLREHIDTAVETDEQLSDSLSLFINPTFLGVILIFAIAVFTIALLASK